MCMDVYAVRAGIIFCGDAAVLLPRAEALHEGGGCFETLRLVFLFFLLFFPSSLTPARVTRIS